jgi:hypothetical protein
LDHSNDLENSFFELVTNTVTQFAVEQGNIMQIANNIVAAVKAPHAFILVIEASLVHDFDVLESLFQETLKLFN